MVPYANGAGKLLAMTMLLTPAPLPDVRAPLYSLQAPARGQSLKNRKAMQPKKAKRKQAAKSRKRNR